MQNLQIDSGEIRLTINNDPMRVISFNPADLGFAEKLFDMLEGIPRIQDEYNKRIAKVEEKKTDDERDGYTLAKEKFSVLLEACKKIRSQIDDLFGAGTSQTVFGDSNSLEMFEQFFRGITPYVQKQRAAKTEKYTKGSKK